MLNEHFPQLRTLSLAQNEFDSSNFSLPRLYLPTLETLVLDKNVFSDLTPIVLLAQAFPYLKELSLQQNQIGEAGNLNAAELSKNGLLDSLRSLNVSGNEITDFAFVDRLALLFPNLTSLRISSNPLYQKQAVGAPSSSNSRSDILYSSTLARMPSLTMLNYTIITARDREEGEIYYLSAAGKEIAALLEASADRQGAEDMVSKIEDMRSKHPRYEALCQKYDRDSVLERHTSGVDHAGAVKSNSNCAPGSLAARLVEATFYVPMSTEKILHRSIARTIDVYRVKALISRELGLRPLQFRLIYESEELDPVRDGLEQTSSDWDAWGDWDVDGEVGSDADSRASYEQKRHDTWVDGILMKDGKKWKKREVEIVDGTRAWGDYIGDDETKTITVRIEPFDGT